MATLIQILIYVLTVITTVRIFLLNLFMLYSHQHKSMTKNLEFVPLTNEVAGR